MFFLHSIILLAKENTIVVRTVSFHRGTRVPFASVLRLSALTSPANRTGQVLELYMDGFCVYQDWPCVLRGNGTVRRQGSYDRPNVHMCRSRSYNVSTGVDKRKVGQNREFRGSGRCCRWNYG